MATTFPSLLRQLAATQPAKVALREKKLGIWQTSSWKDFADLVQVLSCGLAQAGVARGDHVALIGGNRPRLQASLAAVQALGAIPVPLYQEAPSSEYVHPLNSARVAFAIVEEQEQVDKLLEIQPRCTGLRAIWFDDPRGLRAYPQAHIRSLDALVEEGRRLDASDPAFYDKKSSLVQPDDVAAMFFTSGTTSLPKGVVHTHRSLISSARSGAAFDQISDSEEVLAFLPPAWLGQNIFSYAMWLVCGYTINFPESQETVAIDLKEIGPTYYFAPPRTFEDMLTSVTVRMSDASSLKRRGFDALLGLARRVGPAILAGEPVRWVDRAAYFVGDLLLFRQLRAQLGLSRLRLAYTAGEAIGPDLFTFFRSVGINLKQLYGTTETAVFVCMQPDGRVKPDTVGVPAPGVEIRVSDSGELLVRTPGALKEYYQNPQATEEVMDAAGWYHTGDAALLDPEGQVRIIDRLKDVGRLAGGPHDGATFAPKYVENKLKFSAFIKEVVAFGNGRDRVCAFINIDFESVGNWAERKNLSYAGYQDLAQKEAVADLIRNCVETANAELAQDSLVAGNQVARFLILHKELDPDDEELTRTRKVRRGFIAERYRVLVDALFDGRSSQYVETEIGFEDGRKGVVAATVAVHDAKTFPALKRAA
ncbi:AMP-dependent synthetase/ligase [Variovorax sp. ZT4R33]|uniref:AMP-dependent synthetase/ligase n=1 Tax=Variovorax sp. ZT4R33 TaxID=3443743 RepID=UPI003F448690